MDSGWRPWEAHVEFPGAPGGVAAPPVAPEGPREGPAAQASTPFHEETGAQAGGDAGLSEGVAASRGEVEAEVTLKEKAVEVKQEQETARDAIKEEGQCKEEAQVKKEEVEEKSEIKDDPEVKNGGEKVKVKEEEEDEEEEEDDDEDDEDEDSEEEEEEEEESLILETRLRRRKVDTVDEMVKQERRIIRQLTKIVKKGRGERSKEESALVRQYPKLAAVVRKRAEKKKKTEARKQEVEEPAERLAKKCLQLAEAIRSSRHLVAYTGAGISTAADIPDYRGPNGVWTLMDQGKDVAPCDLARATPTYTHRALFTLYKRGKLRHVVSQNCDGLHLRSGLPRGALSEIHGNMFVEICKKCRPARPFVRLFDVTERTNKNRHATMRRCYVCGTSLSDTIVHFGEKGQVRWPINWNGAVRAAEKSDVILCLGSSLKVLRRYGWLWCMDRPKRQRPKLFIVNLQWTPKDCHARLKLSGRCDEVMRQVMAHLGMEVPEYCQDNDPLLSYATPLNEAEAHTTTRTDIITRSVNVESAGDAEDGGENGSGDGSSNGDGSAGGNIQGGDKSSGSNGRGDLERQVAALREDHDYLSISKEERRERAKAAAAARRAGFDAIYSGQGRSRGSSSSSSSSKSEPLDYRTMEWPRDALYLPYEPSFEWVGEGQTVGEDVFCCDCCDPAKKRRRARRAEETSSSEEEEEEEEEEDGDGKNGGGESEDGEASDTNSKSSSGSSGNKNGRKLRLDLQGGNDGGSKSCSNSDADSPGTSKSSTPTPTPLPSQPGWFGKGRKSKRQRCS